jgi:hypothetical protein
MKGETSQSGAPSRQTAFFFAINELTACPFRAAAVKFFQLNNQLCHKRAGNLSTSARFCA